MHRIELMSKGYLKPISQGLVSKLPIRAYNINDSSLSKQELRMIEELLADPIVDIAAIDSPVLENLPLDSVVIELSYKSGVSDPAGKTVKEAIEKILGREIGGVSFSKQYLWTGKLDIKEYTQLQKQLGNPLINDFIRIDYQNWDLKGIGFHFPHIDLPRVEAFGYALTKEGLTVDINTTYKELIKISGERLLALNLEEMLAIRELFSNQDFLAKRKEQGLQSLATDAEVECIAQTWSEHCKHKKFNGKWMYTSEDAHDESGLSHVTDSIFKSIICDATKKIEKNNDWLVSVFEDNAGVIKLNQAWNLAHKVETHNFPSTLDPFGGANTGSGGVFRDPKSTGIGMTVVSSQYGFRVPHPDSYKDLPSEILSPPKILEGIVAGVEDYGNKMGIPTMCGNVFIDDSWLKCGVYVGAVAVAPSEIKGRKTHIKEIKPGYLGLSLGGKVGKDGIHGATASSTAQGADAESNIQINQAVQIGDPIVEKCVFDAMDILRDNGYIEATQDCGAGGWNSALGELALLSKGAAVDLTHAPEKYKGLNGWEKLISEAQEREIIVIKPNNLERVLEICKHYNVEATPIATFNDSGYYHVRDQDTTIVYLPLEFMHKGLPQMLIKAQWKSTEKKEPDIPFKKDLTDILFNMLYRPNIQLYDWIITRYDHEVRGGSLIKPIIGIGRGRSDAIAYRPVLTEKEVVIESWGSNPWQGEIDAYHMGKNNVVDAIGKIVAAGGSLEKIVFNGNTICPKPENDSYVAAQVIRMLKGAADAELLFNAPTISGKDSTSMERSYISTSTGKEVIVKGKVELLMSALSVIPDDATLTTADFKIPGDIIYIIGETKDELGASEFYMMHNHIGRNVPKSNLSEIKKRFSQVSNVIMKNLVHSAQYVSKGGLYYALANPCIAGDIGASISLDSLDEKLSRSDKILGSESTGRFIVSVHPSKKEIFEEKMKGAYIQNIGIVRSDTVFDITYHGKTIVHSNISLMREKNKGDIKL
jgi:phosphoribosylformylglycinamidine synthase